MNDKSEIELLLTPHEEVEEHEDDWELFRRSYVGNSEYKEGEYLEKHDLETSGAFASRVKQALYTNYSAPVVDIYNSYLHRERPVRDFGGLDETLFADYLRSADFERRSHAKLMRELSRWAGVYGHMGIIVDKPISDAAVTRADEINMGVRPYLTYYKPADIVNWVYEPNHIGPPTLQAIVLHEFELTEGEELYKVWYNDRWELWSKTKSRGSKKEKITLISSGDNPLGIIPFVLLRNRDDLSRMSGISDIADIAHANKRIYRYDSAALEIISRTAFPFLEAPADVLRGANTEDMVIGTSNVLERDIADSIGHRWIEPSHASLQRILEWRTNTVNDIREMAKMGQGNANARQGSAAYSGVALEVKYQQMNAMLSDKAENMEQAEERIFELVARWEGKDIVADVNIEVRYPRKFGVRDAITDLDSAIRAKEVIFSPVYDKLTQKNIASRTLADMGYSSEDIAAVKADIDAQEYVPAVSKLTITGGANGVNAVESTHQAQDMQAQLKGLQQPPRPTGTPPPTDPSVK